MSAKEVNMVRSKATEMAIKSSPGSFRKWSTEMCEDKIPNAIGLTSGDQRAVVAGVGTNLSNAELGAKMKLKLKRVREDATRKPEGM